MRLIVGNTFLHTGVTHIAQKKNVVRFQTDLNLKYWCIDNKMLAIISKCIHCNHYSPYKRNGCISSLK